MNFYKYVLKNIPYIDTYHFRNLIPKLTKETEVLEINR